jgi:parallel beta-helix repeat protein
MQVRHCVRFGVRRLRRLAAFFASFGLALNVGMASASADPLAPVVGCGQTLAASVKLTTDLVNCPADGLVIGADGITVDLNGHTIGGTNAAASEGIADDGHGGVVITNGTIRDFFVNGVGLRHAPASRVRDLTVRQIGAGGGVGVFSAGLLVSDSPSVRVENTTVVNNVQSFESDGIVVNRSPDTRLQGNRLNQNSWDGLFVLASPNARVIDNTTDGNANNGMEVNSNSESTWVVDNVASGNGNIGIAAGAMHRARIVGNTAAANGLTANAQDTGLFFFDLHDSLISGNRANRNAVGIDLFGGQHGSDHNRVVDNTTNDNTVVGLVIDSGQDGSVATSANDNTVVGNVADRNQGPFNVGAGLAVFGTGNELRANVTDANIGDGIAVSVAGNSLTDNTANTNGGHGINTGSGTIDGGHNRARDNRLQPQCVGLTCS